MIFRHPIQSEWPFRLIIYLILIVLIIQNQLVYPRAMGACVIASQRAQNNHKQRGNEQSLQLKIYQNPKQEVKPSTSPTKDQSPSQSKEEEVGNNFMGFQTAGQNGQPQKIEELSNRTSNAPLYKDIKNNTPQTTINQVTNIVKTQETIQDHLNSSLQATNSFNLQWDTTTTHANCYRIEQQTNKASLKYRDTEFNRCQITTKNPFPNQGIHILTVRIVKQQPKRAINIGLIAQSRKNLDSSGDTGDKDSIGFWNFPQKRCQIDVDGDHHTINKQLQKSLYCGEGSQLQFKLDINDKLLTIMKHNPVEIATSIQLPDSLKTNKLYAFVSMIQKDDQIEVSYTKQQQT